MRKLTNTFLAGIFVFFMLASCSSSESKKADYLPEVEIEVPELLKDNDEVVAFVETSSDALNEWSVKLEDLAVECEPYIHKEESELSTMEKVKFGTIAMKFMATMGEFSAKAAEVESSLSKLEEGLNEEEIEALSVILEQYEKRIEEIGEKYENFGNYSEDDSEDVVEIEE